ncbi:MAG: hypothetical protein KGZ83_21965 [Sulfuricella sp.]|nr:hypothetical protein [Sulfuricella sp.]
MKIQSSEMSLSGQHLAVKTHTISESLKSWVGDRRPDFEGRGQRAQAVLRDSVAISQRAQAAAAQASAKNSVGKTAATSGDKELESDPRVTLIRLMVEALTGRKIRILSVGELQGNSPNAAPPPDPNQAQPTQAAPAKPAGYGVEYDYHESYSEMERSDFAAQGVIKTADGQEIQFNLQLSMARSYSQETNVSVRLGDALPKQKDPLVINFGGPAAQLGDTKFAFDLDSDGKNDQVSFVGPTSGFIALDKNGDGKVNDGKELFGAQSGDGFKELAAYDEDGNGWIDDNDSVFAKLQVWSKDAQGNDVLGGLKEYGVGALFLGSVATPFEVKNTANQSLGTVRASGVYVNENGSVGTLQHVDLTV